MVDPPNTTKMIDTGQIDGRCAMGTPNYGNCDQKRLNLVENARSNQQSK